MGRLASRRAVRMAPRCLLADAPRGLHFKDGFKLTPISFHLSTVRDTSLALGTVFVIIWVVFLVLGTSNGVNLTDGLDGLASGTSIMTLLAFVLIGVWEFRQSCGLGSSELQRWNLWPEYQDRFLQLFKNH